MNHAIETSGLTRRFGRVAAVDDLTVQVPAGSIFALVGPNGAGKTTTIKLLVNLMRPTRGSANILGVASTRLDAGTFERIGYVSENQRLPEHLTPANLLDYCRPFYPGWDDELSRRLQKTLNVPMNARLGVLSRGTRMKAALLSALAYRPELLVLDEPFGGLDPLVRDELVQALLELAGEKPWTVFISSHDIEEVERLADWVAFLDNGKAVFVEQVSQLLRRFRMVELIGSREAPILSQPEPGWIVQGAAGRTLRVVDTDHDRADAHARLATACPNTEIRIHPMTLRDIFVVLARQSAREMSRDRVTS